ncbi:MAG: tRNA (adenosine(37)-N6)-threonylcarbamoyltransferase complex dimerization subunit type 1 TsaB, partial [Gammaproteobacteria bacterium]|nr:tRNA (adenosine(37)-N6)-threonylcarbamoyltransferase complex dimerization subunit type 1 TsaB [Gammaproteobacteria bacterium]
AYGERLRARLARELAGCGPERLPSAQDVARLAAPAWARGEAVPASEALPVYLRDRVVRSAARKV